MKRASSHARSKSASARRAGTNHDPYYASDRGIADEIESLLAQAAFEPLPLTPQQWTEFRAVLDALSIPRGARLTDDRAAAARAAVPPMDEFARLLGASVKGNREKLVRSLGRDRTIWLDCLIESLPSYAASMTMGSVVDPARSAKQMEQRDRAWAQLIVRAAEERFAGEKFVIFAAPSHLIRGNDAFASMKAAGVTNMGMVLDQRYGEQIYAIHLAVYGGASGVGTPIPPAPAGTIAELLHRTGDPCRVLDLSTLPPDHWLRGQPLRLDSGLGGALPVIWPEVVDGILYIERERPLQTRARMR